MGEFGVCGDECAGQRSRTVAAVEARGRVDGDRVAKGVVAQGRSDLVLDERVFAGRVVVDDVAGDLVEVDVLDLAVGVGVRGVGQGCVQEGDAVAGLGQRR